MLKKNRILSVVSIIFSVGALQAADQTGIVTLVEGTAKKQNLQETDWTSVQKNAPVGTGDRLRTLQDSRAELELAKIDRIRLAPKTTIEIQKLYEESRDQKVEAQIALQSGDVWAKVGKKPAGMKLSISTPVAVAAITGTVLRLHVDQDSSAEVKVYNGEVVLQNAPAPKKTPISGAPVQIDGPVQVPGPQEVSIGQWSMIVKSMQVARINKKGQVVSTGSFSAEDSDEQSDWIRWNQERDGQNP